MRLGHETWGMGEGGVDLTLSAAHALCPPAAMKREMELLVIKKKAELAIKEEECVRLREKMEDMANQFGDMVCVAIAPPPPTHTHTPPPPPPPPLIPTLFLHACSNP